MRLVKKAQCTLTLGGPESGWRPKDSAPYGIQTQGFALEIRASEGGFYLFSIPDDGSLPGDTWHVSLDEAISQAEFQFGVSRESWNDVSLKDSGE